MGGDMLISFAFIKDKYNLDESKKRMMDYVSKLTEPQILGFDMEEFYENYTGESPEREAQVIRKDIIEAITDFFDCLRYRDVTQLRIHNCILYLSGGVSWGDSPTDSYVTIKKLQNLPFEILEEGGIYLPNIMECFLEEYNHRLPKKLKEDIEKWQVAEQI